MPLPTTHAPGEPLCGYCFHFRYKTDVSDDPVGSCHRYPPQVLALVTMSSSGDVVIAEPRTVWPQLHHEDGCSEWKQETPKSAPEVESVGDMLGLMQTKKGDA